MMQLLFDPAYLKDRLDHCQNLARNATLPSIRQAHLAHARHYERLLESQPAPLR